MKLRTQSRDSSQRPALPPTRTLLAPAVHRSRAVGRDSCLPDRESGVHHRGSRTANHSSPITQFLIGSTAIRNARNSSVISTKSISNRPKIACRHARFLRVLHSSNHNSRASARGSLPTNHESRITSHGIIMLSNAQRASLTRSPVARPAPGNRLGAKPASACGHLTLRH
jgi:hypothetical protein